MKVSYKSVSEECLERVPMAGFLKSHPTTPREISSREHPQGGVFHKGVSEDGPQGVSFVRNAIC